MKKISTSAQFPSQDATSIQITLQQQDQQILVTGTQTLSLGTHETLSLEARGGNGQDGLIGKNGFDGRPGRKGDDATPTRVGEDGYAGENGGPGQPGSNGTKAGSGGNIDVFVEEKDSALLPVIKEYNVWAGTPGRAGQHGVGGRGGAGGEGGAACKWTETEHYMEVEYYLPPREQRQVLHGHSSQNIHYHNVHTHGEAQDSHHHGHFDTVQYEWYQPPEEQRTVHKTRLLYKRNPGGQHGRSGQPGFTPTHPLYAGTVGHPGQFNIHVTKNGSTISTHQSRYDFKLTTLLPQKVGYKYEPGEMISLSYTAENTGKTMPTPLEPIPVQIEPSSQFTCTQISTISGSIAPGQKHQTDHPIQITVPTVAHNKATPYQSTTRVTAKLINSRLGTEFATDTASLDVQYPAALNVSQTGFSVHNQSQKALGKTAHRKLTVTVRDATAQILQTQEIDSLTAQSTHVINFRTLPLGAAVWFDKPAHYVFDLGLEPIDKSQDQILIQRQATTIQSLFQLPLRVLSVDNESQSGIYEPGDSVLVTYDVDNGANDVDYPGTEPLSINLASSVSFTCEQQSQVTQPILAKKQHQANQPTILKIAPVTHTQSGVYRQDVPIRAQLKSASYQGVISSSNYSLPVQYPVQLIVPQQDFAILKNSSLPLKMSLANISNNLLGTAAKRTVQVNVTDSQHRVVHSFPIASLAPHSNGQTIDTSTMDIRFPDTAWLGEQSHYFVDLLLQPNDKSFPPTVIQRKPVSMRLVTAYEPAHTGAFTLVLNQSTSSEVQRAWHHFLSQLSGEKNIAIYDTSHYKEFPVDKLLSDNSNGSLVILDGEQAGSITAKQTLDAYQKHRTGLIAVSANPHTLPINYSSTTEKLDWIDEQSTNTNHSYDELIRTLLRATDEELSHQLEIKLDYFFANKNRPDYHVQRIQEILRETFPNRTYHVSCKRVEGDTAALFVRRLADPTHESVKVISSEIVTPEMKQAFVNALPFAQKLKFFTAPSNPHRDVLATSIKEDLQSEQKRLNQTQGYGSWWQKMKNDFDQSHVDMRHLKALVTCLKRYQDQTDFTSFNAWSPLVISMITQVKKQVEDSIGFWDKFFHFFSPQAKVRCAQSALALCDEALSGIRPTRS